MAHHHHEHHDHHRLNILRILLTAAGLIALHFLQLPEPYRLISYLILYLLIGADVVKRAAHGILHGPAFTEKFLMTLATIGAFALALFTKSSDYFEAVAVMLFYQIGEFFEHRAVEKSRASIVKLMDIRPDTAHMEQEGAIRTLHPEKVPTGSIIQVLPGEKVPLDGVVEEGVSALNTMALTGESMPRDVQPGEKVLSGSVNLHGLLRIRTTENFGTSTVSRILEMAEHAARNKAQTENLVRRFARVYTPVVCLLALAVAILPPFITLLVTGAFPFTLWLYRALTFLVISCPCALVIGVPLAFFAGIGAAGRAGVLVKGAHALENLARVRYALLDKTGTLTRGIFEVTKVQPVNPEDDLLFLAAHGESATTHPIGRALQKAYPGPIQRNRVTDIAEISGKGISARIDGRPVLIGNAAWMQENGIAPPTPDENGTIVHLARDGRYAGWICVADQPRQNAVPAIRALKEMGVNEIIMLTGDRQEAAGPLAAALQLDGCAANLLPGDKVHHLEQVLAKKAPGEQVLFAGDGINDAPVLTRADIGVAMGGAGSDAAMEAANVVLMEDDLMQLPRAIRIARQTMAIVRQNIGFSLAVKFLCLLLGALGFVHMGAAIFADVGVMILAVLNAIRPRK